MLLYIDTNVFLNVIYKERKVFEGSKKLLNKVEKRDLAAVTSSITLLEIRLDMVRSGYKDMADKAVALVEDIAGLDILPLDQTMVKVAAEYVVLNGLTVHDAYHFATALSSRADAFVTRDEELVKKISKHIKTMRPEENP
ncbi:MAG: putative nucleic acid-binding protein [Candidatus Nitrosomirales archaeon]|jgi:predicted nucleic acid-binding protein